MFTTMQGPFEIENGVGSGVFILKFRNPTAARYNLIVFGHQGEKIWEKTGLYVTGAIEVLVDLNPLSEGAYVMVIESDRKTWVRKLTVEG